MSQYNKVSTEITPEMKSSALENLAAIRSTLSEVLTINSPPTNAASCPRWAINPSPL